jgi:hypothetical protein
MPTELYRCDVCFTLHSDKGSAKACEKQPINNPYNIKKGDHVIIGDNFIGNVNRYKGTQALVEFTTISHTHNVNVRVIFKDEMGQIRNEELNPGQCIPFIDAKLPEIVDALGEAVHNLWMAKRKAEKGWHNPDECPENNFREGALCYKCCFWLGKSINEFKCGKSLMGYKEFVKSDNKCSSFSIRMCPQCHDCMRPYKDLPDSEKELDRAYPAEFIKILDSMGFMLTVKPKII